MNIKKENGYTGVSIAVTIIIIFIFISVISMLIYNYNSSVEETRLKAEATAIGVDEIEKVKAAGMATTAKNNEPINGKDGFYETITIEDYADNNPGAIHNLVKKATVKISYMFKAKEQNVEFSTIISREN